MNIIELRSRHEALKQERTSWEADWKKLAAHFLPRKCRLEGDTSQTNRGTGSLRGEKLDSTAFYAMRDLAAGLHGGLTSPARPWFNLAMRDQNMTRMSSVKAWLDEVTRRMRFAYHSSNFYNAISLFYSELATFGTAFMFEVEDEQTGIRFIPLTAGEFCLDADDAGRIDTVYRTIHMTLRQLVQKFGEGALPEQLREMYKLPANWNERYQVVHAVYPEKKTKGEKPYVSVYYLDGFGGGSRGLTATTAASEQSVLERGGFHEFPGFGVRWDVTGGDVYGKGPAHDTLADSVLLQQMTQSVLKALHKEIDPPLAAQADFEGLSLLPGAVNVVRGMGQGQQAVYPILQVRHNIEGTYNVISQIQTKVRDGLFNNLFRMLLGSDRRQITAREVAAREEEKLILIGPVLERLNDEFFIPLTERTFNILQRAGKLPPPPDDIAGQEFAPEFVSILAQAQKMVSTGAVEQFAAFVGNVARVYPDAADTIDVDAMVDNYADYLGVEADMLRGQDERDDLRAARQQQQQMAEQMAQAQEGIGMVEQAGDAGSALQGLLGGMGTALDGGA